jgi:hypothetical protein
MDTKNAYFGGHFASLNYFICRSKLVPVLALNYRQYILSQAEVRKVHYSLDELCHICLFEFVLMEGASSS